MSRIAGAVVVSTFLLAGCGDDSAADCTEQRELEDPASFQHVVGDGDFEYLTNPPTSGPHVGGAAPVGVLEGPIEPPVQVRILEDGVALVQYDPAEIESAAVARFAELGAVVAVGVDLPEPLVVTAWTWKLSCPQVDADRITRFIDDRADDAPGGD